MAKIFKFELQVWVLAIVLFFTIMPIQNSTASAQGKKSYVDYVDTRQGTDSHFGLSYGNTYPITAMPFAMHAWSPHTGPNGEGFKYQYFLDKIRGFQQVHQCSPWVSDYAVYTLMPVVGELKVGHEERASQFSHDNEVAKPHYYSVKFDNGILSEIAPTTRGSRVKLATPKSLY